MPPRRTLWFPVLCSIIVGVSMYDTAMIVKYADCISDLEENPIGCWLLDVANGEIGLFVRAKLAGTITVLTVLIFLWKRRSQKTLPVTASLAVYQMGLLAYIMFA